MTGALPETVFSPRSELRNPWRLLAAMGGDLWRARGLAWRLAVRDISAKYRQAWLGLFWAFLPPVATTLMFLVLRGGNVLDSGETGPVPYAVYVMWGSVYWMLFRDAMATPITVVTGAKSMLAKLQFPREAVLLSGALQVLFNFAITLLLGIAVLLWYGVPLPWTIALVPLAVLAILLFGFLIGTLLVPLGLLYSDIQQSLNFIVMVWMFVTPVGYAVASDGALARIMAWNPMTPLLTAARDWTLTGDMGALSGLLWVGGGSVVCMLLAWMLFRLAMPIVIERAGS
jgi:lipopolysaccharide transport system permease protein